jgi:NADH-quinone oxidoreductase subunit D
MDAPPRLTAGFGRIADVHSELTVSTGELASDDFVLTIGPQHPAAHGVIRLALKLDGEHITSVDPIIGYMHRGAEKLFEARDYRQILVLANRHDWLSAFNNELGVALAVERMLGMQVPERATWIRTLLAELNRVLNHLVFLGAIPSALTGRATLTPAFTAREAVQAAMEEVSGGRMHYMFNQMGGLKQDLPDGWLARTQSVVSEVRAAITGELGDSVRNNPMFRDRTRGLGVLPTAIAETYGVSGPLGRASGLDLDLRRDEPYLAYGQLPPEVLRIVTRTEGDALARLECLVDQVEVSLDIADHCLVRLSELPAGPVNLRLPKVLRAPEGETYAWTENPLGINGYYLVSRGERTPWRLKLRTASFNNVQALPEVLTGATVADLVPILASMFFVVGDIDR